MTADTTKTLTDACVQSFIGNRLDYCNVPHCGIVEGLLSCLYQPRTLVSSLVFNGVAAAARLPLRQRVQLTLETFLVHRLPARTAPAYIPVRRVLPHFICIGVRPVCSADSLTSHLWTLIVVLPFSVLYSLCNSLPQQLRQSYIFLDRLSLKKFIGDFRLGDENCGALRLKLNLLYTAGGLC